MARCAYLEQLEALNLMPGRMKYNFPLHYIRNGNRMAPDLYGAARPCLSVGNSTCQTQQLSIQR